MAARKSGRAHARSRPRTLGIGIIGLGWVAGEHIKAFQQNPHSQVVALSSHDHAHAAEMASRYDLPEARLYTDYQELLKDPQVDAVAVCSINHLHVEQAVAAAEAGKHVLIEKPIALDRAGLRRVRRAIEKAGVKSQGGFELNWGGYFQSIQRMVDEDFFGEIHYAECDYFSGNWEKWYAGYGWVKTKEKGGSALAAAGCHAVDAIRQFMRSDAVEVFAYSGNFTKVMEWDPIIATLIKFKSGAIGKVGCALEGNVKYTFNVRLHGAKGTLINDRFVSQHLDPGLQGWAHFPTILPDTPEVTHHPFPGEIDDFIAAILEDRPAKLDIREDSKTYDIMFAAEESARTGRPVRL